MFFIKKYKVVLCKCNVNMITTVILGIEFGLAGDT